MVWQYLITGTIILAALILTGLKILKFFTDPLHKCDGCASSCGGCALEDLKKEIQSGKRSDTGCKIQDHG